MVEPESEGTAQTIPGREHGICFQTATMMQEHANWLAISLTSSSFLHQFVDS